MNLADPKVRELIPARYNEKTELKAVVTTDAKNIFDYELSAAVK
jgi:hypothetical protein